MALTAPQRPAPGAAVPEAVTEPVLLHLGGLLNVPGIDVFEELCRWNPELRLELTAEGVLIIMPPAGGGSSNRNWTMNGEFYLWAKGDGSGIGFESSGGFVLPNGAKRSPDLSWVRRDRWEALTEEEREKFLPLCPDFVVELRSPSDRLRTVQEKMEEYIANGAQLGWLIDPLERKVHVYRPSMPVEILEEPQQVSGDPLLPGFILKLSDVWG
jgi:Uma2 family endonuclease